MAVAVIGVLDDHRQVAVRWRLTAHFAAAIWALACLGAMYEIGRGVPQDPAEGARWLRRAAEQGDPVAQHNLGFVYETGRGVMQDYPEAVKWYRKAAEQGMVEAQITLADMLRRGRGMPQDYAEAHKWLSIASALASGDLQKMCANAKKRVEKQMTAALIAEAQKQARDWIVTFEKKK